MVTIGIDPGLKGGLTVMRDTQIVKCIKFSEQEYLNVLSHYAVKDRNYINACVERVSSRPGQGAPSTFTFGKNYGFIQGLLFALDIPFTTVPPQTWKKEFSLIGTDKQASIETAQHLFPKVDFIPKGCRVPSDGMAESALICEFYRRTLNGNRESKPGNRILQRIK